MRQQTDDERRRTLTLLAERLDDELLLSLLAQDVKANFELLFSKYGSLIYKRALRATGNHEDAEEIVQDTFSNAYEALIKYSVDRIRSLLVERWLCKIAKNQALNKKRKQKKDHLVDSIEGLEKECGESDASKQPELATMAAEGEHYILECVNKLPEEYQALIKVYLVYDVTDRQLAKLVGKPVSLTKSLLTEGIALLREMLEKKDNQSETNHHVPREQVS